MKITEQKIRDLIENCIEDIVGLPFDADDIADVILDNVSLDTDDLQAIEDDVKDMAWRASEDLEYHGFSFPVYAGDIENEYRRYAAWHWDYLEQWQMEANEGDLLPDLMSRIVWLYRAERAKACFMDVYDNFDLTSKED